MSFLPAKTEHRSDQCSINLRKQANPNRQDEIRRWQVTNLQTQLVTVA
jgi:hypothetical protein